YQHYDPKYDVWPARKYVGDSIRYLVQEFHIDGLRFDSAKQIQHFEFLTTIVKQTKEIAGEKPFYCVSEYLPDDPIVTIDRGG
ncbi:unnamed protein product, partial [Didymodactylos carnosus]